MAYRLVRTARLTLAQRVIGMPGQEPGCDPGPRDESIEAGGRLSPRFRGAFGREADDVLQHHHLLARVVARGVDAAPPFSALLTL